MLTRILTALFLLLQLQNLSAQNLVLNPDFEQYGIVPCGWTSGASNFNAAIQDWTTPTTATPDIFSTLIANSCSNFQPNSSYTTNNGHQGPHSGNIFAGFYTYVASSTWREYLQGKLSSPMTVGQTYVVSFYISLGDNSKVATNNIGLDFSTAPINLSISNELGYAPLVNFTQPITDTTTWILLSDTIVCTAPWQNFIVGNFYDDASTNRVTAYPSAYWDRTYYYVDDFSVAPITTTPIPPIANFNSQTSICQNACVTYNNTSQNATSYQWTFPSGTPSSSTSASPTVCYPQTGVYDAELIATNSLGSDTLLFTNYITVNILPAAGTVSALPDTICSGNNSQLTNTGALGTLQWQSSTNGFSYSDIPSATLPNYSASSLTQTTYYRIKASNGCGSDTSAAAIISVIPAPAVGALSASRDSMCAGTGQTSTLSLTSSSGNLAWETSTDGISYGPLSGASGTSYTTPPGLSQNTFYRVIASGGSTCPPDTSAPLIIHIQPFPVAFYTEMVNGTVVTFSSVGSSSDVIGYSWSFGDGTAASSQPNPTHTFSKSDTFEVCLTVVNGSNCSYTLCKDVIILGTGIEELGSAKLIQLYPNPVSDLLNVSVSGLTGEWQVKVYNVLGQELMQHPLTLTAEQTIPLQVSTLAEGTYYLVLTNGDAYYNKRFVHIK